MAVSLHRRTSSSASSVDTASSIKSALHDVDQSVHLALQEDALHLQTLKERVSNIYSTTVNSPQNRKLVEPSSRRLSSPRPLAERRTPPTIPLPPWAGLRSLSDSLDRMQGYRNENICTDSELRRASRTPSYAYGSSLSAPAYKNSPVGRVEDRLARVLDLASPPSSAVGRLCLVRPEKYSSGSHVHPLSNGDTSSYPSSSPRPAFGSPIERSDSPKCKKVKPPAGPWAISRQELSGLAERMDQQRSSNTHPEAPPSEASSDGTDDGSRTQKRVSSSGNSLASQAVQSRRASWGTAISWQSGNTTSDSFVAAQLAQPAGLADAFSSLDGQLVLEEQQQANMQEWLADVEGRLLNKLSQFQQLRRELAQSQVSITKAHSVAQAMRVPPPKANSYR